MFLLVWGKHTREKHLGYVADYCPVCRKIESFEILERRQANHLWFVPVERGRILSRTQICGNCRTESPCHVGQFASIQRSLGDSMESLIEATFPNIRERNSDRLAVAESIAKGDEHIDGAVRQRLLLEVFTRAEPHFRSGYGHQGRRILTVGLRPLWPQQDEIRACIRRFKSMGCRMGALLTTDEVMSSIYPALKDKNPNRFEY